jgi:virulence factor Mce-like protein
MRRALLLALIAVLVAGAYLLSSGSGPTYRVDAIFDSAKGMVPGQLVKIAGARVGSVTGVRLEPGPTARLQMSIERRFGPFHADASCRILPEGFISENYVECNPGSTSQRPLAGAIDQGVPTVPLSNTSVPVSLQDVINVFSLPVDQRLHVLINELGIGTAGEGTDVNAILRRANPALTRGDRVLSILDAQNRQIAGAVGQTNQVLTQLAQRSTGVRSFVDRAAAVAATTSAHRSALSQGVKLLPGLLTNLRRNLAPIDRVVTDGTPLLRDLRAAAPGLTQLTHTLPAFTGPGLPAAQALARATGEGRIAVGAATPVVSKLAKFASTSVPILEQLDQLLASTRDKGGLEGILAVIYSLAADTAGYDSTSHVISITANAFPACFVNPSTLGCSHDFSAPGQGRIPVNDTSLGPQPNSKPSLNHSQLKSLLTYLLK